MDDGLGRVHRSEGRHEDESVGDDAQAAQAAKAAGSSAPGDGFVFVFN